MNPLLSSPHVTQAGRLTVESFHDPVTGTFTHLVIEPLSGECAVVDSVLDHDPATGMSTTGSADQVLSRIRAQGLRLRWLLETHVHADHLSAADYLKQQAGGQTVIGSAIVQVQQTLGALLNDDPASAQDGRPFDRLISDGGQLLLGDVPLRAVHTPGHTPACMTFVADSATPPLAFVGDTLFPPEGGTARCDFPGGDAVTLYRSIQKLLALPGEALLFMCHDYPAAGREAQHVSTVAEERQGNVHAHAGIAEAAFVAMRQARDATLQPPRLFWPSVRVNLRAGQVAVLQTGREAGSPMSVKDA